MASSLGPSAAGRSGSARGPSQTGFWREGHAPPKALEPPIHFGLGDSDYCGRHRPSEPHSQGRWPLPTQGERFYTLSAYRPSYAPGAYNGSWPARDLRHCRKMSDAQSWSQPAVFSEGGGSLRIGSHRCRWPRARSARFPVRPSGFRRPISLPHRSRLAVLLIS